MPSKSRLVEAICFRLLQRQHQLQREKALRGRTKTITRFRLVVTEYNQLRGRINNCLDFASLEMVLFAINE